IRASVEHAQQAAHQQGQSFTLWTSIRPDIEAAFHASLWVLMIVSGGAQDIPNSVVGRAQREQALPSLLEHVELHFPLEFGLLKRHILPLFRSTRFYIQLQQILEGMLAQDRIERSPMRRDAHAQHVRFKVGQVLRHKRYGYEGVITGW